MTDRTDNFPSRLFKMNRVFCREVPSQVATRKFVDELINLLFPIRDRHDISLKEIDLQWKILKKDFLSIVKPLCEQQIHCEELTDSFFNELPLIYARLMQDGENYYKNDPAAHSPEEVILCYPGFYAVAIYRISHLILSLGVPILPRVISEYAHSQTGIDIHPGADIGQDFYIDHGTGIVIGETTVIGNNVRMYQGVTLGATFVDKSLKVSKRHPTIEDNVIIYAGSTILGGGTVIGHDTIIGGNVWLTDSVPPYSMVYHRPDIYIKDKCTGDVTTPLERKKSKD